MVKNKTKKDLKNYSIYGVNLKESLIANSLWLLMLLIVVIISIWSIDYASTITEQPLNLMYIVADLFFILKMLSWVGKPIMVEEWK